MAKASVRTPKDRVISRAKSKTNSSVQIARADEPRGPAKVATATVAANAAALDPELDSRSVRADARDEAFFAAIANGRTVEAACACAGYSRTCVYRWREQDTAFAEDWARSRAIAADLLEEEADRRGRQGVEEPIFFQGNQVGEKRKYSDALLLARLKALRPDLYRERYQVQGLAGQTVTVVIRDLRAEMDAARVIEGDGGAPGPGLPAALAALATPTSSSRS